MVNDFLLNIDYQLFIWINKRPEKQVFPIQIMVSLSSF